VLRQLVPERYLQSPEICEVIDAVQPELDRMQDAIDDVLAQFVLNTATWGLSMWERDYGIESNVSQSYEERRDHVRSKLRGTGTMNCDALEQIAAAYVAGRTEITEVPEKWLLRVAFVDVFGVPSNLEDLKAVLEEMRPAHLLLEYIVRYRLWKEVRQYTWGQLKVHTWAEVKGGQL
jgi:hypothetical protein